jgi:hypothetical protein
MLPTYCVFMAICYYGDKLCRANSNFAACEKKGVEEVLMRQLYLRFHEINFIGGYFC